MRFTVFTPTYNRANTLERLYRSIQRQSFRDFEWLIIDDGSEDDTDRLFQEWVSEQNDFSIRYYKVCNGGKHRAINFGLKQAEGELFFIADSDDYLTDDALRIVDIVEKTIPDYAKSHFAGVCGLDGYANNEIVGTTYTDEMYLDIIYSDRKKHNICGDKKEVFYTDVLRKFPFPEFDNEKFVPEYIVWTRIGAEGYKLRYFNEIIYIVEYQENGISKNYDSVQKSSPKGWALGIKQDKKFGILTDYKLVRAQAWYYNCLKNDLSMWEIAKNLDITIIELLFCVVTVKVRQKAAAIVYKVSNSRGRRFEK